MGVEIMASQKKFRDLSVPERIIYLSETSSLSDEAKKSLLRGNELIRYSTEAPEKMLIRVPPAENHLTFSPMPIGILPGITINGVVKNVPLQTEEPSVIAAAANAARMAEKHGGFNCVAGDPIMIGQVQIVNISESRIGCIIEKIKEHKSELISIANTHNPHLVAAGGGVLNLEPKLLDTKTGKQLIIDFKVDTRDAMGANAVSKMAEGMASRLEELTGGKVVGRILSNLAVGRTVNCVAVFDKESLALKKTINGVEFSIDGSTIIDNILHLDAWASVDQFRATTHNKGIMNGISAVALALGQDTRAIESCAHSFAAYNRPYGPLSYFGKDSDGNLVGLLVVPISVGIIGGTMRTNDVVRACFEIVNCSTPGELAGVMAAVGLAQNLSALRMLAGEGISNGHLPLDKAKKEFEKTQMD